MRLNQSQLSRCVVEFFATGRQRAKPADVMRLKAESESDAIAQANWLACHTHCHHFHVRAVESGAQRVIYRSSAFARAA